MNSKEESIPMITKRPKNNIAGLFRTVSCIAEPSEVALNFLINNDHRSFTNLLAEICPLDDVQKIEDQSGKGVFPLAELHWINTAYGIDQGSKTLLHLAVEQNKEDFVKTIISAGARADLYNDQTGNAPIHVAAEKGNLPMIKILLDFMSKKPNINKAKIGSFNRSGETVLHIAARRGDVHMLRYLLAHPDLDNVDPKDLNGGQTPLYLAAKNSHSEACQLLISYNASLETKCFGKAVKEVIGEKIPYFDPFKVIVIDKSKKKWNIGEHLNRLLDLAQRNLQKGANNSQNLLEFMIYMQQITCEEFNSFDGGGLGLFQKACNYGLHEHAETMLDSKMDPNAVVDEASSKPVLLAAFNGYHKVLQTLLDHKKKSKKKDCSVVNFAAIERVSKESVLHWVLKRPRPDASDSQCDYEACFNILMQSESHDDFNAEIGKIVNHKDEQRNTPLHYATQQWNQTVIKQLLERGANIGIRNLWDDVPITLIMPETMESFLNDFCLKSKNEVTHDDFELELNYSFLAPPVDDPVYDETDPEGQEIIDRAALPETESLWYMSQSKNHRHLLNHPVIMSFLWLKWQRIRGYFNRNLRFYLMFVVCLSWYIFERFGGTSSRVTENHDNSTSFCSELTSRSENSVGFWFVLFIIHAIVQAILILRDWRHDCLKCNTQATAQMCFTSWLEALTTAMIICLLYFRTQALWIIITILLALLMLREVFQMTGSLKRYLISPENWLEMIMITLVGVILWIPDESFENPCTIKRHLASITIILSWAEFITLVARHPRLARYNIYVTMFYKVLQTFFLFLLWYSFFIVAFGFGFYIMLHKDMPDHHAKEDEYAFFNSPWLALVKTSTMFIGEIEFSDLPVDIAGPMRHVSYLFLLAFIFLIVVVLMNLLNGLAVSDTGRIREKAEIVSAISRVETISYIESLLLGDPFDFLSNWPPIRWVKAIPSLALCRCLYRNAAVRDVSIRITGATGILLFYTMLPTKTLTLRPNKRPASCISSKVMSDEVINGAKTIVIRREEQKRWHRMEQEGVSTDKMEALAAKVELMEKKLDKLLNALRID